METNLKAIDEKLEETEKLHNTTDNIKEVFNETNVKRLEELIINNLSKLNENQLRQIHNIIKGMVCYNINKSNIE